MVDQCIAHCCIRACISPSSQLLSDDFQLINHRIVLHRRPAVVQYVIDVSSCSGLNRKLDAQSDGFCIGQQFSHPVHSHCTLSNPVSIKGFYGRDNKEFIIKTNIVFNDGYSRYLMGSVVKKVACVFDAVARIHFMPEVGVAVHCQLVEPHPNHIFQIDFGFFDGV